MAQAGCVQHKKKIPGPYLHCLIDVDVQRARLRIEWRCRAAASVTASRLCSQMAACAAEPASFDKRLRPAMLLKLTTEGILHEQS